MSILTLDFSGEYINIGNPVNLISEKFHSYGAVCIVGGIDFQHVSPHPEGSPVKIHIISGVLNVNQLPDYLIPVFGHAWTQRDHHILEILGGTKAINEMCIRDSVVGSSGSGKSTLIKLLMKELDSTSGKITVSGERLEGMKHRRVAKYRRKLGVVFQDFRLLKDRNVYENVAFAQRVIGRPTRVIRKRVPEILQEVGLADKYRSFPDELSGRCV